MVIAKSFLKKILGVILVIVGVLALFTPLTPGSWLAIIGLELLGWKTVLGWKTALSDKIKKWWT